MPARDRTLIRNLPNALTLARLCAVPVFIGMMIVNEGPTTAAGLLFLAAALTDFLDGQLARRMGVMSQFGKVIDPIADRLLVNSAAVLLCWYDPRLWGWEWAVVVLRDFAAMYGYSRMRRYVLIPDVTRTGKVGMFTMMAGMTWALLLPEAQWPVPVFQVGLAMSVFALGQYVWKYRFTLRDPEAAMLSGAMSAAGGAGPTGEVEGRIYSDDPAQTGPGS